MSPVRAGFAWYVVQFAAAADPDDAPVDRDAAGLGALPAVDEVLAVDELPDVERVLGVYAVAGEDAGGAAGPTLEQAASVDAQSAAPHASAASRGRVLLIIRR